MTREERNEIVEAHLNIIWWAIHKNRPLLQAALLDDEDVFQELAVRMIKAVAWFYPTERTLRQHLRAQMQYAILLCRLKRSISGIKGTPKGARNLTTSLDALLDKGLQI